MRVLLDTNVISELGKPEPEPKVKKTLKHVGHTAAHLSVMSIGELLHGARLLPLGQRRQNLETWIGGVEKAYWDRILPIDIDTARIWAETAAACRQRGVILGIPDGLIAATAMRHGLHLMTRNAADFEHVGVMVINPWIL